MTMTGAPDMSDMLSGFLHQCEIMTRHYNKLLEFYEKVEAWVKTPADVVKVIVFLFSSFGRLIAESLEQELKDPDLPSQDLVQT